MQPLTHRQLLLLLPLSVLVVAAILATRVGQGPTMIGPAAIILLEQLPGPLLWLLAAYGLGSWAAVLLPKQKWCTVDRELLVAAAGVATLLWLDTVIGSLGLLAFRWVAFAFVAVPALGGVFRMRQWTRPTAPTTAASWTLLGAIVPLSVLLVAALSTPGWLWQSEFGGYDALSYHLQLPREWLLHGAIVETPHNAYGYLPNAVEAAFMHLGALAGQKGMWAAMEATQLLAAGWTVLAAALTARLARRLVPDDFAALASASAAVVFLATPWVIVTGSLAYDEPAVLALTAAALLLVAGSDSIGARLGTLLGVLLGGACLAKLSTGPLVVAPLIAASVVLLHRKTWKKAFALAALLGLCALAPWLIRTFMWTGNPVFPMLTSLFGTGPWTAEQLVIWNTAHGAHGSLADRLFLLFNEFFRQGIGPSPNPSEPWLAQWSIMPMLGAGGAIALALRPVDAIRTRRAAMLVLFIVGSLVAWLLLTHMKARFLLPLAVPLAALATAGAIAVVPKARIVLPLAVIALAIVPLAIYLNEAGGMPARGLARAEVFRGDLARRLLERAEHDTAAREVLDVGGPQLFLNHLLPSDARILLVGEAAPFHFAFGTAEKPRLAYSTVWTRGVLEEAMLETSSPAEWIDRLEEQGFTHVYIHPSMLARWHQSGWLAAPLSEANLASLSAALTPVKQFNNGAALFSLRAFIER